MAMNRLTAITIDISSFFFFFFFFFFCSPDLSFRVFQFNYRPVRIVWPGGCTYKFQIFKVMQFHECHTVDILHHMNFIAIIKTFIYKNRTQKAQYLSDARIGHLIILRCIDQKLIYRYVKWSCVLLWIGIICLLIFAMSIKQRPRNSVQAICDFIWEMKFSIAYKWDNLSYL